MTTDTASRRTFLATAASYGRILGANDRPRIGVIGTGGRGQYLMKESLKLGGMEFVAICDVYDVRRAEAAKIAGPQAEQYADHRQVIARKDIDAVIVATLVRGGQTFELAFDLPAELIGVESMEVAVESQRICRAPPDVRDLSLRFGAFTVR